MISKRFKRLLKHPISLTRAIYKKALWQYYNDFRPNAAITLDLGDDGLRITLTASDALAHSIYWHGKFEPDIFAFVRNFLRPGMTVFDLGANIGQYTLLAAYCVGASGQVHSFEPANREFSFLQRNVLDNGFSNVFLQQKAVSNFDGYSLLNVFSDGGGAYNTLGKPAHKAIQHVATYPERVECVRLDSYIELNQVRHIDLLKIDIEGGELNALLGASELLSRDDAPLVVCEFGDETLVGFGFCGKDLHDYFSNHGFLITKIVDKGNYLEPVMPQTRYGANYVVVKPHMLTRWNLSLAPGKG